MGFINFVSKQCLFCELSVGLNIVYVTISYAINIRFQYLMNVIKVFKYLGGSVIVINQSDFGSR